MSETKIAASFRVSLIAPLSVATLAKMLAPVCLF